MAGILVGRAVALDPLPPDETDSGVCACFHHKRTASIAAAQKLPTGLDHGEETKEEDLDGGVMVKEEHFEDEEAAAQE